MAGDRFERVRSVCPYCAVGCQLAYDPASGRAAGLEGAVNRDGRLCPKGIAAFDGVDPADRLTSPLVRAGGELREASWEEALGRAADGLTAAAETHGPDALAFLGAPRCTNEENYLFQKIARLLGTNNVDNRARACHAATERAMADRLGTGAMTNTIDDLAEADAFLVVGANPAERQPIAFDRGVRSALGDGATLIGVDPRRSATTRLADHHLAPRPGTDTAVLTAMARVVVDEGLLDEPFVASRTTDYAAFAAELSTVAVEAAAATAGVDADAIRAAARAFGRADRGAALTGTGLEPPDHADTTAPDALLNLLLLTGNLGQRGTGMNLLRGLNNEQGANDMGCRPDALPGHRRVTDETQRARLATVWGDEPPAEPGRPEADLVADFGAGIRAAWVLGENPAITTGDADAVAAGLDALDPLIVQEVARTATVDHADVVLPAAAWTEKAGTVTNLDRQVQRMRPAADPPPGVRTDLDILQSVGRRVTETPFDYEGPSGVFAELRSVTPPYAGMRWGRIGRGSLRWPCTAADEDGVAVLHRDQFEGGDRTAPFAPVPPLERPASAGIVLVTGRTVVEFVGDRDVAGSASPAAVQLHPDDAADRGIADGDRVQLESDRGSVAARADVTTDVRPGTAYANAGHVESIAGEGRTPVRVRQA